LYDPVPKPGFGAVPVPLSAELTSKLAAPDFPVTEIVADLAPVAVGVKLTVTWQLPFGASTRLVAQPLLPSVNLMLLPTLTLLTVTFPVPELV
jgi:hypothetical protein